MQSATVSSFPLWSKETEYLQADKYSNASENFHLMPRNLMVASIAKPKALTIS